MIAETASARLKRVAHQKKKKTRFNCVWENGGFFQGDTSSFKLEKENMPENTLFYVNQGYFYHTKCTKRYYYTDVYIIAEIMPLPHQPKDAESYKCKDDEVKILRTPYERDTGKFLGLEYCIALIKVRDDPDGQFFDYGH